MDRVEEMLRNELRSPGYELPLDSSSVLSSVRRRRRRREVAAAAIAVIVVAGLVWTGFNTLDGRADHNSLKPAEVPSAGIPTDIPPSPGWKPGNKLKWMTFTSANRGHVVVLTCGANYRCRYRLGTTNNGGTSWRYARLPIPESSAVEEVSLDMQVFADGGIMVAYDRLLPESGGKRLYTRDDGRSWQERPYDPQSTIEVAPPNAHVSWCLRDSWCKHSAFVALLPDGRAAWLGPRVPQGLAAADILSGRGPYSGADGSLWYAGATNHNKPWVAVSRDRGRRWTKTNLPVPGGWDVRVETRDGVIAYAMVRTTADAKRDVLLRTADGGKTWHKLQLPEPGKHDPSTSGMLGMAVALDGGVFVSAQYMPLNRSRPDGTGFVVVPGAAMGADLELEGERLVVNRYTGGAIYTSADGEHWQPLVGIQMD
jgi:hypothetical protein